MGTLENVLAAVEAESGAAIQAVKSVEREMKKARLSAASGQLKDLRAALQAAERLAAQLASTIHAATTAYSVDEQAYFASGHYTRELLDMAAAEGVSVLEQDGRLLCYPFVIRVVESDQAVQVDKAKLRTIRPSRVVALLRAGQTHQPRFKPEVFLESLVRAYDLVAERGAAARLARIYEALTLLPGQNREYTKQEFARDIYLLDQSGIIRTKSGRALSLPASTTTKQGEVLITVTKSGQQKLYAGIAFS